MYREFETKTSYRYLKEVIKHLDEPLCMLGGWAVFFHVNKKFENAKGRPYLGSRDIDLGFRMKGNLQHSGLSRTISVLTEKLKFKPLSFRLMKEVHTETEEEITEGYLIPAHFIFPMYIDLIVDSIPADFKKVFGFHPIDEPLLKIVFDKKEFVSIKEFGKSLILPKQELLLAMKICSIPDRDKEHKKIKDICDMFALAWYSNINLKEINLRRYLSETQLKKCLRSITDKEYAEASAQIGHAKEELKRVIGLICERE